MVCICGCEKASLAERDAARSLFEARLGWICAVSSKYSEAGHGRDERDVEEGPRLAAHHEEH
jgi:hypothetical protein